MGSKTKNSCILCGYCEGSFFKFPKDPTLRAKWFEACKLELRSNVTRLCHTHFREDDIKCSATNILSLKKGVIPSVFQVPLPTLNYEAKNVNVSKIVCVLCHDDIDRDEAGGSNISFHKFPTNEQRRNEWMKACHFTCGSSTYKPPSTISPRICSKHFLATDFDEVAQHMRRRLKLSATPSIFFQECDVCTQRMDTLESSADAQNELENVADENEVEVLLDDFGNEHQEHMQDGLENVADENQLNVPDSITDTPKIQRSKRVLEMPRYVGDICSLHLQTPRRAKVAMSIAKAKISSQQKQIKTLQTQLYRMKRRVQNLKGVVNRLKLQQNLTNENLDFIEVIEV